MINIFLKIIYWYVYFKIIMFLCDTVTRVWIALSNLPIRHVFLRLKLRTDILEAEKILMFIWMTTSTSAEMFPVQGKVMLKTVKTQKY